MVFGAGGGGVGNQGPEGFEGEPANCAAGDGDGGERGLGVLGEADVVEADDGQIGRDANSAVIGGVHGTNGHEVVGGDNGRGGESGEQFGASKIAALDGKIGIDGEGLKAAEFPGAGQEGELAALSRGKPRGAADKTNAGVAEGADMVEGSDDAMFVIDGDVADAVVHAAEVEVDGGDAAAGEGVHDGGVNLGGKDGDAGHLESEQAENGVAGALGVVVGIDDNGFHVFEIRGFLEGGDNLREEGVPDIGDDDAEDVTAANGEVASGNVGGIAEGFDGGEDAVLGCGPDAVPVGFVEDKGDGGDGNAGAAGDIADVGDTVRPTATGQPPRRDFFRRRRAITFSCHRDINTTIQRYRQGVKERASRLGFQGSRFKSQVSSPQSTVESPRVRAQGPSGLQSAKCQVPSLRSQVPSPKSKAPGLKSQVRGPRSTVQVRRLKVGAVRVGMLHICGVPTSVVKRVIVLGGGSAGFIAALTLKRRLPQLEVTALRSPDIGVIGVGEGTTVAFPRHFFENLKLKPKQFYAEAEPTWKLGIKFLWGSRPEFYYTFMTEFGQRVPGLSRPIGFYASDEVPYTGTVSALMAHDKAFPRQPDGQPKFHNFFAFHIENKKLVGWLGKVSVEFGVEVKDATVKAETGPEGIAALVTDQGERMTADLYVDASGFRSELLGRALGEPFISYADSLFCDRAVIGGWARTDEPIKPYTLAETMDAGWCWQIEHEHWINRGYVYSSNFITDEAALGEFLAKNPKVATEPRRVKFRTGRYARNWVGNVVGIGNAVGFVEPLEATALQVICVEAITLADSLGESACSPTPTLAALYNGFNTRVWDDVRDFLAIHYKFNTRLDTPFWRACRADTAVHGAEPMVEFYRENGPSGLSGQLLHSSNSFGVDGYLSLLVGQAVPHAKPHAATPKELESWRSRCRVWAMEAQRAMDVKQCLEAIRQPGMKWE